MIEFLLRVHCRFILAVFSVGFLASCDTSENKTTTAGVLQKAAELKTEADQLAADTAGIQLKIRDLGGNDISGPEVLDGVLASEKKAAGEQARLGAIQAGLESANRKLAADKEAFASKYLKP